MDENTHPPERLGSKRLAIPSVGKGVDPLERSGIVGGSVRWSSCFGNMPVSTSSCIYSTPDPANALTDLYLGERRV